MHNNNMASRARLRAKRDATCISSIYRDIQAVKISRKVSNLNKDTILVNMYDSPELSSYKKKLIDAGQYEETLENLDNFLTFQKR